MHPDKNNCTWNEEIGCYILVSNLDESQTPVYHPLPAIGTPTQCTLCKYMHNAKSVNCERAYCHNELRYKHENKQVLVTACAILNPKNDCTLIESSWVYGKSKLTPKAEIIKRVMEAYNLTQAEVESCFVKPIKGVDLTLQCNKLAKIINSKTYLIYSIGRSL